MHGTLDKVENLPKAPAAATERALERSALLAGLVIDANGNEMVPSRATTSFGAGSARYYLSTAISPGDGEPERIPAARLDSSVVAILRRVRLLGGTWQREDITAIVRRVLVLEDAIILQLDKRLCLAAWRAQEPMLQRITTGDVIRLVATCLARNEEINEAGTALCINTPRHSRARKIRATRTALLFQQPSAGSPIRRA